jgi:hypothetical protein
MAEVLDLSTLKNKQSQPEALTPEEEALAAKLLAEHPEDTKTPVDTAFVLILDQEGKVLIAPLEVANQIMVSRTPNADDFYKAAAIIQRDAIIQSTAAAVQQGMLQVGAAMREQAQSQQIAARLQQTGLRP